MRITFWQLGETGEDCSNCGLGSGVHTGPQSLCPSAWMRAAIHTEKLGLDVTIGTCDVPGASSGLVVYTIKAQDDSDWQELGGESGVS